MEELQSGGKNEESAEPPSLYRFLLNYSSRDQRPVNIVEYQKVQAQIIS